MIKKLKYQFIIIASVALLLQFCATPGPLDGGPEDIDPPIFLGSEPTNYSTNQKPNKIYLEFDEFLVLKEINQNLIISPPLNEKPDIKLRGRKVLVKNDRDIIWEDNTTYTYFFGDAISDLHEENPYEDFEFVFSTGEQLDTLSIRGKVLQAQHLIPEESVYVALYKKGMNDTIPFDSLPYLVRPYYIARTNELGEFQLNNIRYDDYMLFAVKDVNSNYYFDLPNEEIAFLDSLIAPQEVFEYIPDTIPIFPDDTTLMDSLWQYHSYTMVKKPVDLFMFMESDSMPRLLETNVTLNKKIEFYFRYPFRDSLKINLINDSLTTDWYIKEYSKYKDTLTLWLKEIPNDTIELELIVDTIQADTLEFIVKEELIEKEEKRKKKRRKKDKKEDLKKEKEVIKYQSNITNKNDFYKPIKFHFETPLVYYNFDNAVLIEDSLEVEANFIFTDSLNRHLKINYDWKEGTNYRLFIPQDALRDMFDISNDSIKLDFITSTKDEYGNIFLNVAYQSITEGPMLIQLVQGEGEKEKIIRTIPIQSDSLIQFNNIAEGDYFLKALEDKNGDGRWNSGSYSLKKQAEKVFFFHLPISVKEGWDIEDEWTIKIEDRKRPDKPEKKKEEE